ncbi:hypothetical protein GCM10020331_072610 [Ectobacillus funiculus]
MKADYLQGHKYRPRKPWWDEIVPKEQLSLYYKVILEQPSLLGEEFASLSLTEKKSCISIPFLEFVPFDFAGFEQTGAITMQPSLLLAYF